MSVEGDRPERIPTRRIEGIVRFIYFRLKPHYNPLPHLFDMLSLTYQNGLGVVQNKRRLLRHDF